MSAIAIERNIPKLYLIKALRWFMLIMPIIVLFFQENGLSMTQVLLLQAIFSIAITVFEIPSGYFSDVIGRKITLVIACTLGFTGFLIYSFAFDFWSILCAEIVLGLGASFLSGTDSALIYDSLLQLGREAEYTKTEGRMLSIGNFSEGIASILGGLLAVISLRVPFYVETAVIFFTIPIALTLVEPERHKFKAKGGNFRGILRIVRHVLHEQREVRGLLLYSGSVFASTLTLVWFIQPYMKLTGLPIAYFGIAWAILQFSVGFFSLSAHRIEARLGQKNALLLLILMPATGYVLLAILQALWALPLLLIFYFVRGIAVPVLRDYVNKLVSSDMRATVLSVQALLGRLVFAIIGPFIGWITDGYSLGTAFFAAAAIFLGLGMLALVMLRNELN